MYKEESTNEINYYRIRKNFFEKYPIGAQDGLGGKAKSYSKIF